MTGVFYSKTGCRNKSRESLLMGSLAISSIMLKLTYNMTENLNSELVTLFENDRHSRVHFLLKMLDRNDCSKTCLE